MWPFGLYSLNSLGAQMRGCDVSADFEPFFTRGSRATRHLKTTFLSPLASHTSTPLDLFSSLLSRSLFYHLFVLFALFPSSPFCSAIWTMKSFSMSEVGRGGVNSLVLPIESSKPWRWHVNFLNMCASMHVQFFKQQYSISLIIITVSTQLYNYFNTLSNE